LLFTPRPTIATLISVVFTMARWRCLALDAAAVAAAVPLLAALVGGAAADGTLAYTTRMRGPGSPLWCKLPPIDRAINVHRTCLAVRGSPNGSPFLVDASSSVPSFDRAVGYESERRYRRRGLHPVRPGDTLDGGRYRVVSKLGWGSFSTVWKAVDTTVEPHDARHGDWHGRPREVAVKIWAAERMSMAEEEAYFASRLTDAAEAEAAAAVGEHGSPPLPPLMRQLATLTTVGPHGRHHCAVFELLGTSLRVALFAYLNTPVGRAGLRGAPLNVVQTVARDLLRALALAHDHSMVHTDLKIANLALRLPPSLGAGGSVSAATADANSCAALLQAQTRAAAALNGTVADVAAVADFADFPADVARELATATFFTPDGTCHAPASVVTIDWGNTEELDGDGKLDRHYVLQTREYRAPEIVAGVPGSAATDIWSVGCIVWDVAVGDFLFSPDGTDAGDTTEEDIEHLALMRDVLGRPDVDFPSAFKVGSRYGQRLWATDGALFGVPTHRYVSLGRLLQAVTDLSAHPRRLLADFLGRMLTLDPDARGSAVMLLAHPFLDAVFDERATDAPVPLPRVHEGDVGALVMEEVPAATPAVRLRTGLLADADGALLVSGAL